MTRNNEDTGLTDIIVTDPIVAEQNELIAQLVQHIIEMRDEIQKNRDLSNLAIATNTLVPGERRPPLHLYPPNPPENMPNNPHVVPTQKSPTIYFTPNPHHASSSYQSPPPSQNLNAYNSQAFPPMYQTPYQNAQNPPTTQPIPSKPTFYIPTLLKSYPLYTTYPEPDHNEEKEKEWRTKKEITKQSMKEEIVKAMKEFHYTSNIAGLNYEDLCIHPDLDLPDGFKVPKFDTFGGTGNPLAHLRAYYDQLIGVGKNEALLMWLFSRSLSGEALE
ncbi:uncharacterized protein LOC129875730 [Solanum dulcamara]|uniref:uncharacterized protein LOC129875730 n=1 Tax=Solanum dulcamara TaxID=45834 RepID=UPI00248556A5|nr:uncharacterized protein LOC129875730 [Solanum dulcamara]